MIRNPFLAFSRNAGRRASEERESEGGMTRGSAKPPPFREIGPITVLIIEDEEAHFHLMKRAISKDLAQASVHHVESATACLGELDRISPDVIVVDYLMPGMNGIEFLETLNRMGSDIPVVMITGQGDESIAVQAMKLGARDYLVKSSDFFMLLPTVIQKVTQERRLERSLLEGARLNELLLDSLPYPAMVIGRDRTILAANQMAMDIGARVGGACWEDFSHRSKSPPESGGKAASTAVPARGGAGVCEFCRADEAIETNKAVNSPEIDSCGRLWDMWWIPLNGEIYLHYAIDITERKLTERALRISHRFLEMANQQSEIGPLLDGFVRELSGATGCSAVAIWIWNDEGEPSCIAGKGCDAGMFFPQSTRKIDAYTPLFGNVAETSRRRHLPPQPVDGPTFPDVRGQSPSSVSESVLERVKDHGLRLGYKSSAMTPICFGERMLGSIYVADTREGMLQPETLDILEAGAMELGAAIERLLSKERLKKSEHLQRFLSSRLLTAQEEERKRIARELHDSIGSSLSAIKIFQENALQKMENGNTDPEPLKTVISMTQDAINESRRIMTDLRPCLLDDIGIVATLAWLCRQFSAVHPDIGIERWVEIDENDIPETLKIVILRIVQEAFHNIAKYSQAREVTLTLAKTENAIRLSVKDDGVGFDPCSAGPKEDFSGGVGLTSMKERTEFSGGSFRVESQAGHGTTICASWYLLREDESLDEMIRRPRGLP
jgi:signal transduction histidine kinase/CheY-like chemotaxis protein